MQHLEEGNERDDLDDGRRSAGHLNRKPRDPAAGIFR
jgi:hypothetical protein